MYDLISNFNYLDRVTGPCEFLVMYDITMIILGKASVTGPCEFLVMYDC